MNRPYVSCAFALALSFGALGLGATSAAYAQAVPTVVSITKPAAGTPILIALPQVSMNLLTTGGVDPKEEWNQNTRKFLNAAAIDAVKARTYTAESVDPASYEGARELQVLKLNAVVTSAIVSSTWAKLPTKTGFDWTLGDGASALRPANETVPAAYMLFLNANGNYSSGGRVALGVLMAVASGGSAGGAQMAGGTQSLSATLVDLNTGQVVWYKQVMFMAGTDLRTEEGNKAAIESLFKTLPL